MSWLTNLGMFETFVDSSLMFAMGRVEVVFDAIVAAPGQFFRNVSPLVPQLFVQIEN